MVVLRPHPSTPEDAWQVSALATRAPGGELHLRYVLQGALHAIRLPPPGAGLRADRLWEHTCAEAFIAAEGADGYVELNVAPSRAWAAYAFATYRERAPIETSALDPRIAVQCERDAITFDVAVAPADLSPAYREATLRVGLSMVVEASDGRLTYWALHHPSAQPDFHHADGFVLRLPPPPAAAADSAAGRGSSS